MIPIIDIHCHASHKIYMCNKEIAHKHYPVADVLPTGMHVDLPRLDQGRVQVIFSNHLVPEACLTTLPRTTRIFKLLERCGFNITNKMEVDQPKLVYAFIY